MCLLHVIASDSSLLSLTRAVRRCFCLNSFVNRRLSTDASGKGMGNPCPETIANNTDHKNKMGTIFGKSGQFSLAPLLDKRETVGSSKYSFYLPNPVLLSRTVSLFAQSRNQSLRQKSELRRGTSTREENLGRASKECNSQLKKVDDS